MVRLRLDVPQWVANEIIRLAAEGHRPAKWEAEWLLVEAVRANGGQPDDDDGQDTLSDSHDDSAYWEDYMAQIEAEQAAQDDDSPFN